jgi:hypothetical protein
MEDTPIFDMTVTVFWCKNIKKFNMLVFSSF